MHLDDEARLAAIERTGLVDAPPPLAFERAVRLAAALLDVPVSHTTLVLGGHQFFPSQVGMPEPFASQRGSDLASSFCRHVVEGDQPFVVSDTSTHPALVDNLAVKFGVAAYVGVPLRDHDGALLGSLCGLQFEPREWTDQDVAHLEDLADFLRDNLRLRSEVEAHRKLVARAMKVGLAANEIRAAAARVVQLTDVMDDTSVEVMELREQAEEAGQAARVIMDAMQSD